MTAPPDPAGPGASAHAFIARLDAAKHAADVAETTFRRESAERTQALAEARAAAWRRADLMTSLLTAVEGMADGEMAAAAGQALLRARLGWTADSDARSEVLTRFAPVAVAVFEAGTGGDPDAALAAYEAWYQETRQSAFWYLFEHYLPDTPLVDF